MVSPTKNVLFFITPSYAIISSTPVAVANVYTPFASIAVYCCLVKNLLMTNKFEKPFQHQFGADLSGLLFELADDLMEDDINQEIMMAVKNWEPRARVINVQSQVQPDLNNIFCRIEFQIIATGSIEVIETSVARLR